MVQRLCSRRMVPLARTGFALLTVVCSLADPAPGRAQSPSGAAVQEAETAGPQSFEVASIKPSAADMNTVKMQITPGGRYSASGVTLKLLIQQAFDLRDFQISGAPGWLSSERYDIVAKAETPNLDRERVKVLLQSLLADRFKLQFHRETRELPIYALVVGRNGHKLHTSEIQAGTQSDGPLPKAPQAGQPGALAPAAGGNATSISKGGARIRMGRGLLNAEMAPISVLASMLAQQLGRTVLDKTGLTDKFDFKLEWTPDETPGGVGFGDGDNLPAGDSPGPSIFTAVQEQLGLKLESQRGPVEILVIEHVEKPTEN